MSKTLILMVLSIICISCNIGSEKAQNDMPLPSEFGIQEIDMTRIALGEDSKVTDDSVYRFVVSISSIDPKESGGDVLYRGVHNEEEYESRIRNINFDMGQKFYLQLAGSVIIYPDIVHFENSYNLKGARSFVVAFNKYRLCKNLRDDSKVEFVFEDILFDTGITHFKISREKIITAKFCNDAA